MKRIVPFLAVIIMLFAGCSKEEQPLYDLVICDSAIEEMYSYLDTFKTENYKIETNDFSEEQISSLLNSITENSEYITSICLYSENITQETADTFINAVQHRNIPVIFAFSDISTETLTAYDKAFCITTDYLHAGEITAEQIHNLWADGAIADINGDKIFSFSVIKDENAKPDFEDYYSSVISGIELYGVPMQINSTVSPDEITDAEALSALKAENEGILVISDKLIPVISQYSTESETAEIITIQQGTENSLAGSTFAVNCFVDYRNYKLAADEILRNYNNRQYPLIESSFFVKDRTVFIPATI